MTAILGQVLIVLGALVFSGAGVGLLVLKDAYARSSAIATAAGLGMSLVLIGVFWLDPSWSDAVKLVLAVACQLVTSAVGSMAIARSAYLTGSPMNTDTTETFADDLAQAGKSGGQDSL